MRFPYVLVLLLLIASCTPHEHDALDHSTPSTASIDVMIVPAQPSVGEPSSLHILTTQPLTTHHERVLHVIAVGDGFDAFAHLHPEDSGLAQSDSHFQLPIVFPAGGRYLLVLDGMASDGVVSTRELVTVRGEVQPVMAEDISCVRATSLGARDALSGFISLSALETDCDDAYELELFRNPDGAIRFSARLRGEPFEPQQYLGAYAHLAIVRDDLSAAYHEHADFGSGMFSVTPDLPPGRYVVFPQVKHGDQLIVTRFLIDVP